ncbi:hypothetical protein PIB30_006995 [Stylosanthes scabra]|uniref:Uncharacterized protein n=1 Tax=Stylosanthes scabra TaxID=79078 RepID=A0ABU6Z348_9FABA|nr:hypothetical protein [Stylosanthes scabra]
MENKQTQKNTCGKVDYPTDTYFPGMKVGRDLKNGLDWGLKSWKSQDDPSPGDISWGLVLSGYPEFSIMNGTTKICRIGPRNGMYFTGYTNQKFQSGFELTYVSNKDEIFYTYSSNNVISRVVINSTTSSLIQYVWMEKQQNWDIYYLLPGDVCDTYGLCGTNSNCITTDPHICQCLKGFSPIAWNSSHWDQGCVRNEPLSCNGTSNSDGFVKYTSLKQPDTQHTKLDENVNLDECRNLCLKNCSCMAFANSDIRRGGSGCVMWFGDLIDLKLFPNGEQILYIRMPASELELQHGHKRRVIIASTIAAICGVLLLCMYVIYRVRRNIAEKSKTEDYTDKGYMKDTDLPLFDLLTINISTNKFSFNNKIGQGGFGPAYKGKLADGQEIAVKRLSHSSGQGMAEFITEVKLISKLKTEIW